MLNRPARRRDSQTWRHREERSTYATHGGTTIRCLQRAVCRTEAPSLSDSRQAAGITRPEIFEPANPRHDTNKTQERQKGHRMVVSGGQCKR